MTAGRSPAEQRHTYGIPWGQERTKNPSHRPMFSPWWLCLVSVETLSLALQWLIAAEVRWA